MCDEYVWWVCVMSMCDEYVWWVCVMYVWCMCDEYVWCMCDEYVWWVCVMSMCDEYVWWVCVMSMCDEYVWCMCDVCVMSMCDVCVMSMRLQLDETQLCIAYRTPVHHTQSTDIQQRAATYPSSRFGLKTWDPEGRRSRPEGGQQDWGSWGGAVSPCLPARVFEERCKLRSRDRDWAPGARWFSCF